MYCIQLHEIFIFDIQVLSLCLTLHLDWLCHTGTTGYQQTIPANAAFFFAGSFFNAFRTFAHEGRTRRHLAPIPGHDAGTFDFRYLAIRLLYSCYFRLVFTRRASIGHRDYRDPHSSHTLDAFYFLPFTFRVAVSASTTKCT